MRSKSPGAETRGRAGACGAGASPDSLRICAGALFCGLRLLFMAGSSTRGQGGQVDGASAPRSGRAARIDYDACSSRGPRTVGAGRRIWARTLRPPADLSPLHAGFEAARKKVDEKEKDIKDVMQEIESARMRFRAAKDTGDAIETQFQMNEVERLGNRENRMREELTVMRSEMKAQRESVPPEPGVSARHHS